MREWQICNGMNDFVSFEIDLLAQDDVQNSLKCNYNLKSILYWAKKKENIILNQINKINKIDELLLCIM